MSKHIICVTLIIYLKPFWFDLCERIRGFAYSYALNKSTFGSLLTSYLLVISFIR